MRCIYKVCDNSCIAFRPCRVEKVCGGNGQLEGLVSFLLPIKSSGVCWLNGKFTSIPHSHKAESLAVPYIHVDFLKPPALYEFEFYSII
jgi:hypothetical protein